MDTCSTSSMTATNINQTLKHGDLQEAAVGNATVHDHHLTNSSSTSAQHTAQKYTCAQQEEVQFIAIHSLAHTEQQHMPAKTQLEAVLHTTNRRTAIPHSYQRKSAKHTAKSSTTGQQYTAHLTVSNTYLPSTQAEVVPHNATLQHLTSMTANTNRSDLTTPHLHPPFL